MYLHRRRSQRQPTGKSLWVHNLLTRIGPTRTVPTRVVPPVGSSHIPILLEVGDFDAPRIVSLTNFKNNIGANATLLSLTALGIFGNGHVAMVEKNNEQIANLFLDWLKKNAGAKN